MCLNISHFEEAESLGDEVLIFLGTGPVVKLEGFELVGKSVASKDDLLLSNGLCVVYVIFWEFVTFGNIYRNLKDLAPIKYDLPLYTTSEEILKD